jgi:hypothetical protein
MTKGGLKFPTEEMYRLIQEAEDQFTILDTRLMSIEETQAALLQTCHRQLICGQQHDLRIKLIKRFIKMRTYKRAEQLNRNIKPELQFASKSACKKTVLKCIRQ